MTHKVGACDALEDSIVGRYVIHVLFSPLLSGIFCLLGFDDRLILIFILTNLVFRLIVRESGSFLREQSVPDPRLRVKLTGACRKFDCAVSTSNTSGSSVSALALERFMGAMAELEPTGRLTESVAKLGFDS